MDTPPQNQSERFLLCTPPRFSCQTSLFSQVGVVVAGSWTFPELSLERLGSHTSSFRTSAKMPSPSEKPWLMPLHWIPCFRRVGLGPGKRNTGAWGCHRGPSSSSKGTVHVRPAVHGAAWTRALRSCGHGPGSVDPAPPDSVPLGHVAPDGAV